MQTTSDQRTRYLCNMNSLVIYHVQVKNLNPQEVFSTTVTEENKQD